MNSENNPDVPPTKSEDGGQKKKRSKIIMRKYQNMDMVKEMLPLEEEMPSFDVTYGSDDGKFSKFKKNPLVPAGALATAGILFAGLLSFRSGNTSLSQQLMRARVLAQGATLGVLSLSVARMQWANTGKEGITEATAVANE